MIDTIWFNFLNNLTFEELNLLRDKFAAEKIEMLEDIDETLREKEFELK